MDDYSFTKFGTPVDSLLLRCITSNNKNEISDTFLQEGRADDAAKLFYVMPKISHPLEKIASLLPNRRQVIWAQITKSPKRK